MLLFWNAFACVVRIILFIMHIPAPGLHSVCWIAIPSGHTSARLVHWMQAEYWAITVHVGPSLDQHFDRGGVGVDRWLRAGNPSHSGLAASHLAFCLAIILLFLHLPSTELIRDPQWRALPPLFTRLTSISVHPLVEITISTNGRTEIQVKIMEIRRV